MLLSIIIPVYNGEQNILRCLNSLVDDKALANYEIIIIDDGSTDKTKEKIESYIKKYPTIKVTYYYQTNRGVSAARNVGIKLSKGKYIWFVDSDDRITPNIIFQILPIINKNYDIILIGMKDRQYNINLNESWAQNKYSTAGSVCNKLFNRTLLQTNNIQFNEKIFNTEDLLFSIQCLILSQKIYNFKSVCYEYVMNEYSCSMKRDINHLLKLSDSTIITINEIIYFINLKLKENKKEYKQCMNIVYINVIGLLYSLLRFSYPIPYIQTIIHKLKKMNLYPIKKTNNTKANLFAIICNIEYLYYLFIHINKFVKIFK